MLWVIIMIGSIADFTADFITKLELPSHFYSFLTQPWTLLTYMITQVSPIHLIVNMIWLYCFGIILLRKVSGEQLLWLYIAGGIAGGILYIISSATGNHYGFLCGSSASVLAVMTATAIMNPGLEVRLWLLGIVKLKWVALITIILLFATGIPGNPGEVTAHAGGIIAGIVYAVWYNRKNVSEEVDDPHIRLDRLLDKINRSGYGSLTRKERKELDDLSNKI